MEPGGWGLGPRAGGWTWGVGVCPWGLAGAWSLGLGLGAVGLGLELWASCVVAFCQTHGRPDAIFRHPRAGRTDTGTSAQAARDGLSKVDSRS